MPRKGSQDSIIRDLEGLDEAADRNAALLVGLDAEHQELKLALGVIKPLKARQQELTAQRQAVTQQFKAAVQRGQEAAITFRSLARGKVGPRNELLVHFKVAPLRKRAPRASALRKKAGGEASGTKPGAAVSPSEPSAV